MAEMIRASRIAHRTVSVFGFLNVLKAVCPARSSPNRIREAEWSDYMLRDVGLSRSRREPADLRASPMDWPLR